MRLLFSRRLLTTGRRKKLLVYPSLVESMDNLDVGETVLNQLRVQDDSVDAIREERIRQSNLIKRMSLVQQPATSNIPTSGFASVGVSAEMITCLRERFKILEPTPTQLALIPAVLSCSDVLLKDATGTGKSLGLLVAVLSKKLVPAPSPRVLFLLPTNHLAIQTSLWMRALMPSLSDPSHMQCITALSTSQDQAKQLALNPHIVIGTPSRILHLLETGAFNSTHLTTLVLDEVDRMVPFARANDPLTLKRNKKTHIQPCDALVSKIVASIEKKVVKEDEDVWERECIIEQRSLQIIACSATLNARMRSDLKNTRKWLIDPVVIDTATKSSLVKHYCIVLGNDGGMSDLSTKNLVSYSPLDSASKPPAKANKADVKKGVKESGDIESIEPLLRIVSKLATELDVEKGLVFADSMMSMERVASTLTSYGTNTSRFWMQQESQPEPIDLDDTYHFDPNATAETEPELLMATPLDFTTSLFKNDVRLVCLEESNSRGLDISDCTHVFLTSTPATASSYLHTSGRTGRFGRSGSVFTLIHERESSRMRGIYGQLGVTWSEFFEKQ